MAKRSAPFSSCADGGFVRGAPAPGFVAKIGAREFAPKAPRRVAGMDIYSSHRETIRGNRTGTGKNGNSRFVAGGSHHGSNLRRITPVRVGEDRWLQAELGEAVAGPDNFFLRLRLRALRQRTMSPTVRTNLH